MRQTVNTIVGRRAAIGSRRISKLAPTSGWPRSAGFLSGRLFPRVVPAPRCMDGNGIRHPVTAMTAAEAIAMARYSAPPQRGFFWNSITLDNRPCHRWHTDAVGSSRQTCASPSCCRYRATTKSASRAARTIQMLTRMTNTPANRVAVRQLGGAALYSGNEGLGRLTGGRTTPPVALGIADRAFAKS